MLGLQTLMLFSRPVRERLVGFVTRGSLLSLFWIWLVAASRSRAPLSPWNRETAKSKPLSPSFSFVRLGIYICIYIPLPTFDLYRPLSIFCNLLLRILNVRIEQGGERWPRATNATRRDVSKEKREQRDERRLQWHRDQSRESFRVTTPWGDAALIFPRIFARFSSLRLFGWLRPRPTDSICSAISTTSLHRVVSISFARWLPRGPVASRYHLDNLYAGGSLKLHGKGRTRESHGNGSLIQFHCVASLSRDFFMGDATRVVSSSMSFVIPRRFRFEVVFFRDSSSGRWHGVARH